MAPIDWPSAWVYAVARSSCARIAAASFACRVPLRLPGGNPVTAVPGLTPKSPVTSVLPVLMTVVLPSTANDPAAPRAGAPAATPAWGADDVCPSESVALVGSRLDAPHPTAKTITAANDTAAKFPVRFFISRSSSSVGGCVACTRRDGVVNCSWGSARDPRELGDVGGSAGTVPCVTLSHPARLNSSRHNAISRPALARAQGCRAPAVDRCGRNFKIGSRPTNHRVWRPVLL